MPFLCVLPHSMYLIHLRSDCFLRFEVKLVSSYQPCVGFDQIILHTQKNEKFEDVREHKM